MTGSKRIFQTPLDEAWTTDKEGLGAIRWEGGKCYKWVQYEAASAGVAGVLGEVAYYYTMDGYKNNIVTSDLSDSVEIGAGVLQAALADGEYGWVQIKGLATLTIAFTAAADGDPLTPTGAGDGTLDTAEAVAALGPNICGIALDASDNEMICDFPY